MYGKTKSERYEVTEKENEEEQREKENTERRGGKRKAEQKYGLYSIEFIAGTGLDLVEEQHREKDTRTRAHNLCSHYATTKIHYGQQALSRQFGDRSWLGK